MPDLQLTAEERECLSSLNGAKERSRFTYMTSAQREEVWKGRLGEFYTCCLRVAAGPSLPNGPITQLTPHLTQNPCTCTWFKIAIRGMDSKDLQRLWTSHKHQPNDAAEAAISRSDWEGGREQRNTMGRDSGQSAPAQRWLENFQPGLGEHKDYRVLESTILFKIMKIRY